MRIYLNKGIQPIFVARMEPKVGQVVEAIITLSEEEWQDYLKIQDKWLWWQNQLRERTLL